MEGNNFEQFTFEKEHVSSSGTDQLAPVSIRGQSVTERQRDRTGASVRAVRCAESKMLVRGTPRKDLNSEKLMVYFDHGSENRKLSIQAPRRLISALLVQVEVIQSHSDLSVSTSGSIYEPRELVFELCDDSKYKAKSGKGDELDDNRFVLRFPERMAIPQHK